MPDIIHARRKLRDDNGPTEQLGPVEQFIELEPGKYWPLAWIKTSPPLLREQLICPCHLCGNPAEGRFFHWRHEVGFWFSVCDACHNSIPAIAAAKLITIANSLSANRATGGAAATV
jgi:hypothetical protein